MMNLLTHKRCITALICALACTIGVVGAKKQKQIKAEYANAKKNAENCKNSKTCYCGYKCGPRDRTKDDETIFVENDPQGHHCYCKYRDLKEVIEHPDKCPKE